MRRTMSVAFLTLPLLGFLWSAAPPARADQWTKTYSVAGRPDVRVETNDGHVSVDTWASKQIEARVETVGWRISNSEVRVVERQTGDRLEFDVRVPRLHFNFGARRSLKIQLKIPKESNLWVRTGDGHVTLQPLTGRVEIRTGDGHITLSGVHGEIRLTTGDGHIRAGGLDGRLDATTGDGHINVDGRFDALNLRTGDGHIEARTQPGSKMAASWTISTGDGRVTLQLPQGFAADLDARTEDGRITMDFPVTVSGSMTRSSVRGKINGGGPTLTVRTGDGSIRIARL